MSGYYHISESLSPASQPAILAFPQRPGSGAQVCLWHQVPSVVCVAALQLELLDLLRW